MNGKNVACVILAFVIAAFVYAGQMVSQKAAEKLANAEFAEGEAFTAKSEKEQASMRVESTKSSTQNLRRFLSAWKAPIDRVQTQTEVEEAIQSSLRMNGLVVISQRFEKRESTENPILPRFIKATIVIQDEYSKTLNWVGDLERRLPLCRINTCHITGAEEAKQVQTEVSLEVPLINLKPDTAKS